MTCYKSPLTAIALTVLFVLSACSPENGSPALAPGADSDKPATIPIQPTRPPNTIATTSVIMPDGSVWFAFDEFDDIGGTSPYSQNRGLYRSKDGDITHIDITQTIRVLKAAPDGSLYVGAGCGVMRYSNDVWDTLASFDCETSTFTLPIIPFDIAFASNGDIWVGGVHALARFDGTRWTEYDVKARRILIAPDGSLWADGWNGSANGDCCFTHLTGDQWVTYNRSADLPVSEDMHRAIQNLAN